MNSTAVFDKNRPLLFSISYTVTSAHASHLLASKYPVMHGIVVPLVHRLRGNTTMHIELRPVEGSKKSRPLGKHG
jgi:hypothetical protein